MSKTSSQDKLPWLFISERGQPQRRMTESTLRQQPSGQWAIQLPDREPVRIVAGDVFLLEVQGERRLMRVRMECREGRCYAVFASHARGRAELRDGLRAGFFDQRERYARARPPGVDADEVARGRRARLRSCGPFATIGRGTKKVGAVAVRGYF